MSNLPRAEQREGGKKKVPGVRGGGGTESGGRSKRGGLLGGERTGSERERGSPETQCDTAGGESDDKTRGEPHRIEMAQTERAVESYIFMDVPQSSG